MKISRNILIIMIIVMAGISMPAIAQSDFGDILSGVLDAMEQSPTTKTSSSDINDGMLASVAESMSIGGTLDYVFEMYNTSPSTQYTRYNTQNYGGGFAGGFGNHNDGGAQSYAYLIPSSAVAPVTGRVTSRYGFRPNFGRMHHGTDIALNVGDTVCAAIDGVVLRVSNDPNGYGLFVCLQHSGGLETRYAHLSGVLVSAGTRVCAGEPIALGGSTGNSTGPHLHFETRVNGKAVDLSYMFDFSRPTTRSYNQSGYAYDDIGAIASGDLVASANGGTSGGAVTPTRSTYVVKFGDTIDMVARKNGLTVMRLCNLNMLSPTDTLQPGRMLKLR